MRIMRYLAVLAILLLPAAAYSHAQVSVGVGVGYGPAYYGAYYAPPVCAYGYYGYYPYSCAPYGYYGPSYFTGGLFIGAGPWYHYGWPGYRYGGYYGRTVWSGHPGYVGRPVPYGGSYRGGNVNGAVRSGYAAGATRGGFGSSAHVASGGEHTADTAKALPFCERRYENGCGRVHIPQLFSF
jgi:hypothetical protein